MMSKISFRNKIDTIGPALHLEVNRSYSPTAEKIKLAQ